MAHRTRRPMSARNAVTESETGTKHSHMSVPSEIRAQSSNQTCTIHSGIPRPKPAWKTCIVEGNPVPQRVLEDHHFREDQHFLPWDKYVELDLPSTRQGIASHPTVILANQPLQTQVLQPLWTRVTTTPFTRKANLCGGMGRRITVR